MILLKYLWSSTCAMRATSSLLVRRSCFRTVPHPDVYLGVVVVAVLAIILTHFSFCLDARRTGCLLIPAACLLIVAVYRVVQTFTYDPSAAFRRDAAFFCLQILFELYVWAVQFMNVSLTADQLRLRLNHRHLDPDLVPWCPEYGSRGRGDGKNLGKGKKSWNPLNRL